MKTQAWVYIVIVVLSIGAGVAIAGVPDSVSRDATIEAPTTTEAPPPTTEPEPPETEAPVETDAPPATDASPEPTTTTSTTTTTTPPQSTTSAAVTTTTALPDRANLDVSVVNGAEVGGTAGRTSDFLEELGYANVGFFDGSEIVDLTVIHVAEGFEAAADRLAVELGMAPDLIRPLESLPQVDGLESPTIVVYLGRDVEALAPFS